MNISADTIQLKNQGFIQAQTESGNGGNITLSTRNLLLLQDNSLISSTASGSGNGGNISINAPIIVGLENSDIVANAVRGRGGNIQATGWRRNADSKIEIFANKSPTQVQQTLTCAGISR